MPRYLVESTLFDLAFPPRDWTSTRTILRTSTDGGVTWLHSYLVSDEQKMFSLYEGPTPEAIRHAARRSGLPIDCIHSVTTLDPYPADGGRYARSPGYADPPGWPGVSSGARNG